MEASTTTILDLLDIRSKKSTFKPWQEAHSSEIAILYDWITHTNFDPTFLKKKGMTQPFSEGIDLFYRWRDENLHRNEERHCTISANYPSQKNVLRIRRWHPSSSRSNIQSGFNHSTTPCESILFHKHNDKTNSSSTRRWYVSWNPKILTVLGYGKDICSTPRALHERCHALDYVTWKDIRICRGDMIRLSSSQEVNLRCSSLLTHG